MNKNSYIMELLFYFLFRDMQVEKIYTYIDYLLDEQYNKVALKNEVLLLLKKRNKNEIIFLYDSLKIKKAGYLRDFLGTETPQNKSFFGVVEKIINDKNRIKNEEVNKILKSFIEEVYKRKNTGILNNDFNLYGIEKFNLKIEDAMPCFYFILYYLTKDTLVRRIPELDARIAGNKFLEPTREEKVITCFFMNYDNARISVITGYSQMVVSNVISEYKKHPSHFRKNNYTDEEIELIKEDINKVRLDNEILIKRLFIILNRKVNNGKNSSQRNKKDRLRK